MIGNPPYGASIKGSYREAVGNNLGKVPDFEIYYYFIELVKKIVRKKGYVSYIIPNTWLFNTFASNYRISILNFWNINEILDCSSFKIFDSATVMNSIILFNKTDNPSNNIGYRPTANAKSFEELVSEEKLTLSKKFIKEMNQNWGLAFKLSPEIISVVSKVSKHSGKVIDYFDCSQGYIPYRLSDLIKEYGEIKGTEIKEKRLWHSANKTKEYFIQEVFGRDITKYSLTPKGDFIKYGKHCASYVDIKFFTKPRILVREITNPFIIACYTEEELINDPQLIVIIQKDKEFSLFFLWGILNSKLATFYHFNHSPKSTKGAFPKILVQDLKEFPIPSTTKEDKENIIILVDQILSEKKQNPKADTSSLEHQIDLLVYHLYGLTFEEAKIIDSNLTKEEFENTKQNFL